MTYSSKSSCERKGLLKPVVLLVTLIGLSACQQEADVVPDPSARPVKTMVVEETREIRELSLPAVIEAGRSAELTFQIAGTVVELNMVEGQPVVEGALLARLDQRDARNRVAQSQAEFDNAEAEFERATRLFEQDAIARSVLESRETQRDVAEASLATSRKALSDTELRAPFSGVISKTDVREFQNVQAKEAVANIQSRDLEAIVNVPSIIVAQLPRVQSRGVSIQLDALPGVMLPATLNEARTEADASTSTFRVSFSFEAPEEVLILPGMTATAFASVAAASGEEQDLGVSIPLSAVLAKGDDKFVWRIDPDSNQVQAATIEVGSGATPGAVRLISGLEPGDEIVIAGASYLTENQLVSRWVPE